MARATNHGVTVYAQLAEQLPPCKGVAGAQRRRPPRRPLASRRPARLAALLSVHVLPRWRNVAVSSITTADVEAWVSQLTAGGLSASRTRQAYLVLRGVLDTAVKARNVASNPAHGVELPRTPESTRRYLTMAELEALAEAAGDYAPLIRVLGYCGIRWGEAVALTVAKCDLLRSRLVVDCSVVDIAGTLTVGPTKSGKRPSSRTS